MKNMTFYDFLLEMGKRSGTPDYHESNFNIDISDSFVICSANNHVL